MKENPFINHFEFTCSKCGHKVAWGVRLPFLGPLPCPICGTNLSQVEVSPDEVAHPVDSSILHEARSLVNEGRNADYGSWEDNARKVAAIMEILASGPGAADKWSNQQYFTVELLVMKLVREANKHKRDNLVDLCGYAELLNRMLEAPHGNAGSV